MFESGVTVSICRRITEKDLFDTITKFNAHNIRYRYYIICTLVEGSLAPCAPQVGLAVDDTKAIQEQAQIQRLSQQVCLG